MRRSSLVLRIVVIGYVGALLALPLGFVFQQAVSYTHLDVYKRQR